MGWGVSVHFRSFFRCLMYGMVFMSTFLYRYNVWGGVLGVPFRYVFCSMVYRIGQVSTFLEWFFAV